MVQEIRDGRHVVRCKNVHGFSKGLRGIAALGLFCSAVLPSACTTFQPRTLNDILSDPAKGNPTGHLQNVLTTENFLAAAGDWFSQAVFDVEIDEDVANAERFMESNDLIERSAQFLSLNVPAAFMGESPATPSCFRSHVQSVASRLGAVIERGITVHVIDCDEPNAFSFGDGHIGICRGFLPELETNDELAFVLAHELAHSALYHNDLLVSAEAEFRNRQLLLGGAVGVTALSIDAALFSAVAPGVDRAATNIERAVGITAAQDDDNDLDSVLLGAGALTTTVLTAGAVLPMANSLTKLVFADLVTGYGDAKSQQELDADRVGLEIVQRAGYSDRAAPFVLSRTWDSSFERGRTFAGGATAARSGRIDLFSMAGIHPSVESRLDMLTSFAGQNEVLTEPTSTILDFCSETEVSDLFALVSANSEFAFRTDQILIDANPQWDYYCDALRKFGDSGSDQPSDAPRAIQLMRGSMLCGTMEYAKEIYAPYLTGRGSSVDYETALAAFEAWLGDSAGAYALLGRLSDRATRSIQVYRAAVPILRRMGLTDLAKAAEHACRGQTQSMQTVRYADVCDIPIEGKKYTVFGAGLAWEQIGLLLYDSSLIPAKTSLAAVARIKKTRYLSIAQGKELELEDKTFCPGESATQSKWAYSERITINPYQEDLTPDWMNTSKTCLTPFPLPKPATRSLGIENPLATTSIVSGDT